MTSGNPKLISFIGSIALSLITAIVLLLINTMPDAFSSINNIVIVAFVVFVVSFVITWVIIEVFIYRKIKSIHETLNRFRTQKDVIETSGNGELLNDIVKEVETWAQQRKDEIEKLNKLEVYRREFLGNVSHELKTPVFNIQGYLTTLIDGGMDDPSINKDYLIRAERNVERMIFIVEDLQAITQLETGELVLEKERFDLIALVKEVFDAQELKAKDKKISFTLLNDPDKAVFVYADKFRVRQVLTNLVVNSVTYGKEDGETRIKLSDSGKNILIEVSDNGIGIAKEHLPRLFERFYRVDKSRSREQGGTGLGLAIVKHIIEAHDQKINVSSTEGSGSVFAFMLEKDEF
jgi:two-component system phosphate regulon sensor histidine kinase PhoR